MQVSTSKSSPHPIKKRPRIKVQASKASFDTSVHKKSKTRTSHQGSMKDAFLISKKIHKLIPEENI